MAVSTLRMRIRNLIKTAVRTAVCSSLAAGLTLVSLDSANAQDSGRRLSQWEMQTTPVSIDSNRPMQTIQMVINQSREVTADRPFSSVRIQNENILNVLPLQGNKLQVSAKATGITQIDFVGSDGSQHSLEVMVVGDVRELEASLRLAFPGAAIQVQPINQGCIISGFVTKGEDAEKVTRIAELYFPNVIEQLEVAGVFTIQLETQIMEVSRTKLRQLGIDWAFANGNDVVAQSVSGLLNASGTAFTATGTETLQFSVFENGTSFFSAIQALRQHGLVKVLASPTLTAIDGRPASFNAGGEIPIVIPAGLGQVAVQYREFGTRLDYFAKVRGNGKIYLEVRPYVSEIDPSRSVSIQGISVPGLRSRFLETGVEMGAGQTLALGGLLQVKSETINLGLPVLADMPYFGTFFRSTREEQNEIELLITVTPHFAGPMDPHEVPLIAPGTSTQPPTQKELFLRGYMETPVTNDCGPQGGLISHQTVVPNHGHQGGHSPIIMQNGQPGMPGMVETPATNIAPAPNLTPSPKPAPPAIPTGAQQPGNSFGAPNNSALNGNIRVPKVASPPRSGAYIPPTNTPVSQPIIR